MPMDGLINTSLLAAYFHESLAPEDLEAIRKANRAILLSFIAEADGRTEPLSREALRHLVVAGEELTSLADWLLDETDHVLLELLGDESPDEILRSYRYHYATRFAHELVLMGARFQGGFHPTEDELLDWRRSLPEEVPHWSGRPTLRYPPPFLPAMRGKEDFLLFEAGRDLRQIAEFLRLTVRRLGFLIEDLPKADLKARAQVETRRGRKHFPLAVFRVDLEALHAALGAVAGQAAYLVEEKWVGEFGFLREETS